MSERYVKVFSGEENLYLKDAPIIIRASALLKDRETGKMIAQLKLRNISGKTVSYVKVAVTQLDSVKNPLGNTIFFEYLDLAVNDGEEFGTKKPLPLPNSSTRAFTLGVSHVGFADGTVFSTEELCWSPEAKDSSVAKNIAAEGVLKEVTDLLKSKSPDRIIEAKALLQSISADRDVTAELKLCDQRLAELNAQKETADQKKKKTKKIVKIGSIAAAVCLVLTLVFFIGIRPFIALSSGDYDVYVKTYRVKSFQVPDGTTEIKDYTFFECNSLTSVTIPDSVTEIGYGAFNRCKNLSEIVLPNGLTILPFNLFNGCSSLESVTIPDSVVRIEVCAFAQCSSLSSITIPHSVKTIQEFAFSECCNLVEIRYEGTVKEWNQLAEKGWIDPDDANPRLTVLCSDGKISVASKQPSI